MKPSKTARAEVVVLRATNYGEHDKILVLYARDLGKVHAIAKGVRRTTSKMGGHLDLCAHASVLLVLGRTLDLVTQGKALHTFSYLRDDLAAFARACYVVELVDRFTEDADPNPELFRRLVRVLEHINGRETPRQALTLFLLQLLTLSGYQPQLHHCVSCQTTIAPGANAFDAALGGVLCPLCAQAQRTARPIGTPALKILRNLQRGGEDMLAMPMTPDALDEAENTLDLYIQQLLERSPRSAAFHDMVRRDQASSPGGRASAFAE